jgi:hypothetical protein
MQKLDKSNSLLWFGIALLFFLFGLNLIPEPYATTLAMLVLLGAIYHDIDNAKTMHHDSLVDALILKPLGAFNK